MIMQRLTASQLKRSIVHWQGLTDSKGIPNRLPYGINPGAYSTDIEVDIWNKVKWDAIPWNPPGAVSDIYRRPDPYASSKPTWKQVYGYALPTCHSRIS